MKVAIVGKGGSGKTTLAATLSRLVARRGFPVLAIDSDPNPNLGVALGVNEMGLNALRPLPHSILERQTNTSGSSEVVGLVAPIEAIAYEYVITALDGVKLWLNVLLE